MNYVNKNKPNQTQFLRDTRIQKPPRRLSGAKPPRRLSGVISVVVILFICGCQPERQKRPVGPTAAGVNGNIDVYQAYRPVRAVFLPLTEIKAAEQPHLNETITAFVALVDSEGSAVKWPGVFRFELYEYLSRSTEKKGKRLHIWEDNYILEVIDPSGAGDAFDAGFIWGMLQGWDLRRTLEFAAAIGASACLKLGCTPGVFTMDEATAFLEKNKLDIEVIHD